MIKSISHRIIAITMAMLMLLSSTGFSMDVHYCQNHIKSISFFGKARSCHDKQVIPPCHKTKKATDHQNINIGEADKDNCCHNEMVVIQKSDIDSTNPQLAKVQDGQLDFFAAFVAISVYTNIQVANFPSYNQYKPPLPERDFRVLYQSFQI